MCITLVIFQRCMLCSLCESCLRSLYLIYLVYSHEMGRLSCRYHHFCPPLTSGVSGSRKRHGIQSHQYQYQISESVFILVCIFNWTMGLGACLPISYTCCDLTPFTPRVFRYIHQKIVLIIVFMYLLCTVVPFILFGRVLDPLIQFSPDAVVINHEGYQYSQTPQSQVWTQLVCTPEFHGLSLHNRWYGIRNSGKYFLNTRFSLRMNMLLSMWMSARTQGHLQSISDHTCTCHRCGPGRWHTIHFKKINLLMHTSTINFQHSTCLTKHISRIWYKRQFVPLFHRLHELVEHRTTP